MLSRLKTKHVVVQGVLISP